MKKFKFTIEGASYSVNVKNIEGNQAEIEVNGKTYAIDPIGPSAQELVLVGGLEEWVKRNL